LAKWEGNSDRPQSFAKFHILPLFCL